VDGGRRLYHEALARAPEARAAFLREACAGDPALLRAVDALLMQPTSGEWLDTPTVATTADLTSTAKAVLTGRRVGVYEIREQIGAGGMGVVYRARDSRLGRDVAIKILPRAFTADGDRLARFEREARNRPTAALAISRPVY
jgi:serine/threonine protein kinase